MSDDPAPGLQQSVASATGGRRAAPAWLKALAGIVLFLVLWFVAAGMGAAAASDHAGWTIFVALVPAVLIAWLVARHASVRGSVTVLALCLVAIAVIGGLAVMSTSFRTAPHMAPPGEVAPAPTSPLPAPTTPPDDATPAGAPPPGAGNGGGGMTGGGMAGGGGRGKKKAKASLPDFPWPPPAASASYVLPRNLFAADATVGQVVSALLAALERTGYVERSFFRTEAEGVALVTRIERISDDGYSLEERQRWPAEFHEQQASGNLGRFLRGLFYVDPGRYRVIVFILQDRPFWQSTERVTGEQARTWLRTGANALPREVAERPLGDGSCTVLIYEFASDGVSVRVVDSRLTGLQHLQRSRVLPLSGKGN